MKQNKKATNATPKKKGSLKLTPKKATKVTPKKKLNRKGKANPNAKLGKDFSIDEVIDMIHKKGGYVTHVADAFSVAYQTLWTWKKKYKAIEEAFIEANEVQLDFTESQLMERIKGGDTTAIIFYLKTKGKARGYVERQEYVGLEGKPKVTLRVVYEDPPISKDAHTSS